jgi:phosphoribosylglycinamide formyltransferase-1
MNLAILISGRGSNMESILQAIDKKAIKGINEVIVISNNEDSAGFKIAKDIYGVKTELLSKKILKDEFDNRLITILHYHKIIPGRGLICLAGFMQILKPRLVNMYKNQIMNVHPSLLPSFKGLRAQKQAIDAGVKISGCTIHFVDTGVDSGPIILQKCVPVLDNDDEISLSKRILVEEHLLYKQAIELFTNKKLTV